MKKINKFIEKNIIIILSVFIVANPVLDVITSININYFKCDFTIGMVIRFLFMAFALYYIIFIKSKDKKNNKLVYILLSSIFLFSLLFMINTYINYKSLIIMEIKNILKTLYFFIMYLFLFTIKSKLDKLNFRYLNIALIIYLTFIFIPNLFGGLDSYDYAKEGKKGLFNSANEISAIISLLYPILLYVSMLAKNKIKYFVISLIYLYIVFSIGTKVPFFALGITLFVFLLYLYIKAFKSKNKSLIGISCTSFIIIILVLIYIVPKTTFYQNIKTHMEYFNIASIKDVFKNRENINNIIFSERITLMDNKKAEYINSDIFTKLLGMGYYKINNGEIVERKTVEIDYFDIFYSSGIGLFIIFLFMIIISIIQLIKKRNNVIIKPLFYVLYSLVLLIAFFSGHVFISPAVSIYAAIILVYPFTLRNKNNEGF